MRSFRLIVSSGSWPDATSSRSPCRAACSFPTRSACMLVAAPWAVLAHDHVALLRIVVCTAETIAGALLYPMIVRTWSDRLNGAVATVLFSVVPISAVVIGNANLTNAFGESIALATMAVVVMWSGAEGQHRSRRGVVCPGVAGLSLARQHVRDLVGDSPHARGSVRPPDCAGLAGRRPGTLPCDIRRGRLRDGHLLRSFRRRVQRRASSSSDHRIDPGDALATAERFGNRHSPSDVVLRSDAQRDATHRGVRRLADSAPRPGRGVATAS